MTTHVTLTFPLLPVQLKCGKLLFSFLYVCHSVFKRGGMMTVVKDPEIPESGTIKDKIQVTFS